ncbi:T9SS type A sorting domain-containing protein [Ancylomarina salipaludis]|uniref:T9SS type A sorting domain-containing protein n=1 Tax=Ancylomarina salipaludis TaxID=2501299 RepID=A0A4Q1JMQ7_9BACT|nr:T9SS type A sorting domain-containing protein [Ancylomarina salipaludis]RXQ94978.1 T9SS type A sorting domain-containing protein [Ancylomarina salipaludis]
MLRLLLVKKHLFLLLVLLLTSVSFAKAELAVHSCFYDITNVNGFYSLNKSADQLDDFVKKEPGFYPNPVQDIVNLTDQEDVLRVRIFSLTGKTLIDIKTKEETINLSKLSKGMYLINFDMKDGKRIAKKIIKK